MDSHAFLEAVQDAAIQATVDNDLVIDLAMGGNQGAGVPAPYGSDGVLLDIIAFNTTITNGSFNDTLPGWETGPLVAASLGQVMSVSNETVTTKSLYGIVNQALPVYTLAANSLQDVTSQVSADGRLNLAIDSPTSAPTVLFVYYSTVATYKEIPSPETFLTSTFQSPVTSYVQNGSYVVDHFSSTGAQVIIDFWNTHLLDNSTTKAQLAKVGNYLWEDSQEYGQYVHILWTPDLPQRFEQDHGYSIVPYLPTLFKNNGGMGGTYIVTDESDEGASHFDDYSQTLTNLYQTYLSTLKAWAASLDMQLSTQPAYNQPVDMLQAIPTDDAPEIESLGFDHNIDWYRQASGASYLAGKRVLSSECGATEGEVFLQTIPELLWDVQRSFVGGVNNFVFHGFPYSGSYPNTTYPVFTTFLYLFAAMHGPHQPAWSYYSDFLDYTSRLQFLAQTSIPKVDVAFYLKSNDWITLSTRYNSSDLNDAGFTYQYLDPANFDLPNAEVVGGLLAPEAQAFKILVVRPSDTLTRSSVLDLYKFASVGLPVVFYGGIPSCTSGSITSNVTESVSVTIERMLELPNVHDVSAETGLAAYLSSIKITPRTAINTSASWYTWYWHNNDTSIDYVLVYNDATGVVPGQNLTTGTVTMNNTGVPYFHDAWTGAITAVPVYSRFEDKITIPLQLAGNQTVLIAFHQNATTSPQLNSTDYQYRTSGSDIIVCSADPAPAALPSSPTSSLTLGPWNLTVESWTAPDNLYDIDGGAKKLNTTHTLPSILPWSSISPELVNVSGIGYYSTYFNWSKESSHALLDLGHIQHTARVSINDAQLPALDVTNAVADISAYLQLGQNHLSITVATPLGNSLIPIWDTLATNGLSPSFTASIGATVPKTQAYGLLHDISIHLCVAYPINTS